MSRFRLPWKRGYKAWEVAQRNEEILGVLASKSCRFYTLRGTARLLGVSTQPIRDWVRRGWLQNTGPRKSFAAEELCRFVRWLANRAEPYDWQAHAARFRARRTRAVFPFAKLDSSRFAWPRGRAQLNPIELSRLVGCHPSLVVKAITTGALDGHRRTVKRWAVTRRAWNRAFPFSAD